MTTLSTLVPRGLLFAAIFTWFLNAPLGVHGQMQSMAMEPKAPANPSTSLKLTIGSKATSLSVADLQAMPQKILTVHNEHTKADETYTGVRLGDLLARNGLPVDKTTHQQMLSSYIKAEGTDKYWVLFSMTEIEPTEHNGTVLIALSIDGKPLSTDGQIQTDRQRR